MIIMGLVHHLWELETVHVADILIHSMCVVNGFMLKLHLNQIERIWTKYCILAENSSNGYITQQQR